MKKFFLVIVFLCASGCLFAEDNREKINTLPEEYRELGQACFKADSFNCCMASVDHMVRYKAILHESGNSDCPVGYRGNMLKCVGSYAWCEPVSEETSALPPTE